MGNTLKSDGDSFPRSCQMLVADHSRAYKSMASGMHMKGERHAFEDLWVTHQSHLDGVKGFRAFHLLRGREREEHVCHLIGTITQSL